MGLIFYCSIKILSQNLGELSCISLLTGDAGWNSGFSLKPLSGFCQIKDGGGKKEMC